MGRGRQGALDPLEVVGVADEQRGAGVVEERGELLLAQGRVGHDDDGADLEDAEERGHEVDAVG